ncbi:hypothetical protein [Radiobacillus sp. PE A8.2]|uniref:hypothetical protein n=1 Tax=Radiobacillus sp. PE A8.2 TaxID=3380349 RepID=UPI00388D6F1E
MDSRIQEFVDFTRTKLGLDDYYLERHSFYQNVNIFNETEYVLCMEWFPNHVTQQEDDDSNPEGTAVVEINIHSRKIKSIIFVMGKTYVKDGISFTSQGKNQVIRWIEEETGLAYEKQFQFHKEEEGELTFKEYYEGIEVSPSGMIVVKFNHEGKLTMFANQGQFPSREKVREEKYTLSFRKVENIAKKQLQLVEFPTYEQKKLVFIFAIEEIYITNEGTSTIPFEWIVDVRSYTTMEKTLYWEEPMSQPFNKKEIIWIEEIQPEQAFLLEPSPDSFPITELEQDKCEIVVKDLLRQEYPNDTGKWKLKTLHRDKGYIHATLRRNHKDHRLFQRKIKILIDAKSLKAINYIDNQLMIEIFEQFQTSEQAIITIDEAYEKIKGLLQLKPYYVYDFDHKQYILCGKLDCQYGIHAENGRVINLDDL